MRGLGLVMAKRVARRAGRVAASLALSLDLDQAGRHANVVDVAEYVLQGLQLVNKLFAIALVEERRHELGLVAQLLERLAHFMALRCIKRVEVTAKLGGLFPGLGQDLAGVLGNGVVETIDLFERARPEG